MANRKLRKLANFRMLAGVLIIVALAPVICAQAPRQLQVEVGANQQISIFARDVSYGEVLRALESKLGWEMEIPPLADELKLSYMRVETTQPQTALAQLLEGSRLGCAFSEWCEYPQNEGDCDSFDATRGNLRMGHNLQLTDP